MKQLRPTRSLVRSSITQVVTVRIRKESGLARMRWAPACAPWRFIGGTGGRMYVLKGKAR